jgi:Glycosyltransferase family 10 (fucosyltransferase) C-term
MDSVINSPEFSNLKKGTANKIRLRFFSSFCDGNFLKSHYEEVFESHLLDYYGPDKKLYITNEDDYTHVVIFNIAMPVLKPTIPKENVIGLAYEPIHYLGITAEFVEYAKKNIGRYFIGDKKNLPSPFFEGYAYMCPTVPLKYLPNKNKVMSMMISEKGFAPGHKYRYKLVNAILRNNLPVDIYGRGCANIQNRWGNTDERLKGEFNDKEPYEDYLFHICIENFQSNEYFSEKILTPLICSTTPIYLGCYNIKNYFGNDVICLTGNLEVDMNIITLILTEPMRHYRRLDIEKIKNTTNFLRNIDKIFDFKLACDSN